MEPNDAQPQDVELSLPREATGAYFLSTRRGLRQPEPHWIDEIKLPTTFNRAISERVTWANIKWS